MATALQEESKRIGYTSHEIPISDLRPGDHIYTYRRKGLFLYAHHCIYVGMNGGEHWVIHFKNNATSGQKFLEFSTERFQPNPALAEDNASTQETESSLNVEQVPTDNTQSTESDGLIEKRTLDRFLKGSSARLVLYNVDSLGVRQKAGTVHALPSKPANKVVETAEYFLAHPEKWGKYDFFKNNCETFCIFCKTGEKNTEMYNDQTKGIIAKCLSPFIKTFQGSLE